MPRIRTIKPEFWDSPGTARASLRARLFFIAMWNWADDYGIGTANPRQLIGFAFPNDPDIGEEDFPCIAKEVSDCFGVVWYEVDQRPYFMIPSWDRHQKTERKAASRLPRPDQGFSAVEESGGFSSHTQGSSGPGTGEQGNRGNREREAAAPSRLSPDFAVTDEMRAWARANVPGVDVEKSTAAFVDHFLAATGRAASRVDWVARWRKWLRDDASRLPVGSVPVIERVADVRADCAAGVHRWHPHHPSCMKCGEKRDAS